MSKVPSAPDAGVEPATRTETRAAAKIETLIERELEGKVQKRDLQAVAHRITQIAVSEQFSGPMPHPRHLREYDEVLPGAAERILTMAEKNLDHVIDQGKTALTAQIEDQKRGMYFGAILFGTLIVGAFASLFVTSNPLVPGLFLGAAALGGVALFVNGRKSD